MYIPVTYFSQQEACITASAAVTSGNGSITTGSYISGSTEYNWIQITNTTDPLVSMTPLTASFNIISGRTNQAKILLVGGGGGGAATDCWKFGDCGQISGGGGGAGGVVYYNNFPLYTGSYTLYVGSGGSPSDNLGGYIVDQDHTLQRSASFGQDTVLINQNLISYTPFTSSQLTAYGGGAGGQYFTVWSGGPGTQIRQDQITPDKGGSGGGAARGFSTATNTGGGISTGIGLGGLFGVNQGNTGGSCLNGSTSWTENGAAGGGGASGQGVNVVSNGQGQSGYVSSGGAGVQYNLKGAPEYFAAGGAGVTVQGSTFYSGSAVSGSGTLGSGGKGGSIFWFGNPSPIGDSEPGQNGTVIIVYPNYCLPKNYTLYRMVSCCDTGSFYDIAVQTGVTFGLGYAIYNPSVSQCMKSVAVLDESTNVSFTLTTANTNTYNYGTDAYSGSAQCLNCRQANGLIGCIPIGNTCTTWTFRYTANLPNPPSTVSYVDCATGVSQSFTLSPANRNGSACVRSGTTPTVGANITRTDTGTYCGVY